MARDKKHKVFHNSRKRMYIQHEGGKGDDDDPRGAIGYGDDDMAFLGRRRWVV